MAAMVVPAAQARVDGGSGWSGVGKARSVDAPSALVAGERHDGFVVRSPDDTVLVRGERHAGHVTGSEPIAVVRAADYKRYWAPDDDGTVTGGPPIQVASEPNGFHWRDGLVGALAALGIALLAFGALLGTQRGRTAAA
ncbi:MAG TPA: hypothetical protein VG479_05205 [Gaiellaceae bacterium]|nr:hypothetical protein [Gaiellaceae bacterium]